MYDLKVEPSVDRLRHYKEERAKAIQAQRYAKRRKEGLLQWSFGIGSFNG